jgi:hypothetical protein
MITPKTASNRLLRTPQETLREWHRQRVLFPVRTDTGRLTFGEVWRKRTENGWVYRAREETFDEWLDWQV